VVRKEIAERIFAYRQEIIDILKQLVATPTVNPPGRNYKSCSDYLSHILSEWKIDHKVIAVPAGDYPRFSIIGSFGNGGQALHFHGHYDVVPASSPEAFKPRFKEGRLFGRGSSDMKGGLTAMLFALRLLKNMDVSLKGRLTFSIVPDEESGGLLGTQYLFEKKLLPPANVLGMIMPEPTSGAIWNGNKAALTLKVSIEGKHAHVAIAHQGVNAFEHMVNLANSFFRLRKKIEKREAKRSVGHPETARSVILLGGQSGSGFNFNAVPENSFLTIDCRFDPKEDLAEMKKEIEKVLAEHRSRGIKINAAVLQEGEPSLFTPETNLAQTLLRSIRDITGSRPSFELCPGLCEIRFFNNRGIPAYAYGPGMLEVAHGPQEHVFVSDIISCSQVYSLTALELLSPFPSRK